MPQNSQKHKRNSYFKTSALMKNSKIGLSSVGILQGDIRGAEAEMSHPTICTKRYVLSRHPSNPWEFSFI